jgi:hypothetical protein
MIQNKRASLLTTIVLILFLVQLACNLGGVPASEEQVSTEPQTTASKPPEEPAQDLTELIQVQYDLDQPTNGLLLDSGGDVDTEVVSVGDPPEEVLGTGNGAVITAEDGNMVEDSYMQFRIDDALIFRGSPTSHAQIEIEYLDEGTDMFNIQYDAVSGGPEGDGRFKDTSTVVKTDSGEFRTAVFPMCDAYFANRTNGGDFRIADGNDGAEYIRRVTIKLQPSVETAINVDTCGANPWDMEPDSEAIQTCIDMACPGTTVQFTSPGGNADYQGYLIDKTIFLVATASKHDLTFSSSDPDDHALLQATEDLLGFVVRLWARSQVPDPGAIDDVTISHLDIDGGREVRVCYGNDNIDDGRGDNWGSWLPECSDGGDPWCSPGGLAMAGAVNFSDANSNYQANPALWSMGLMVDDVRISNVECATALSFEGAAGTIQNSTIDQAGDHVHEPGCSSPDPDEGVGDWSDGITFIGPAHFISGNTIINASDVGIVHFGGVDTVITNNTIRATEGNHGIFAAIAIHPWHIGNISGGEVRGNTIINEANESCGGIHAGINIGTHMWGRGCTGNAWVAARGTPNECLSEPSQPMGQMCNEGEACQQWAYVAEGTTFMLQDNFVSGAQINYLIEGLDLMGELIENDNISETPRMTDWVASQIGCGSNGTIDYWSPLDFVAHHPSSDGWTDQRVHCER